MIYSSDNGTLFYYDHVLYKQCVCEPTILFLLGLDSIINETVSDDCIVIPKTIEIYSSIEKYLSFGKYLTIYDDHLVFNCTGLKHLINKLSGVGSSRIVPIIWKQEDKISIDNFDDQAQKLISIFTDAGYELKDRITAELSKDEQSVKLSNSQTYKQVAYHAMYQFALGVLYGCRCLGYDDGLIWRSSPQSWYTGQLVNLVNTAYETFSFHEHPISRIDNDPVLVYKYKGIQQNKLWNFNTSLIPSVPDGFTQMQYYNLQSPIKIFVNDSNNDLVWIGENQTTSIVELGYSKSPSAQLDAYVDTLPDHCISTFDLRYNPIDGYWSSEWDPRHWSDNISDIYKLYGDTPLYSNSALISTVKTYLDFNEPSTVYIYNDHSVPELQELRPGFISISELNAAGVTTSPGTVMYDALENELTQVYDTSTSIIIDDLSISYDEFYSNSDYGIIRKIYKVFNTDQPMSYIIDCYYDSYSDKYCIPEITTWVNRSAISDLMYIFVDGTRDLYIGNDNPYQFVYDTDTHD